MSRAFPVVVCLSLAWLASTAGCGHNIGDPCSQNIDCSTAGDRYCDTASPGGYCTVDGCDTGTCPDNQLCVRFFTIVRNEVCHPSMPQHPTEHCDVDERCVCDETQEVPADPANPTGPKVEKCMGDAGHCAPETSERRWCMKACIPDNNECRPQYECRRTGTLGAEPVPGPVDNAGNSITKPGFFCAPSS